MESERRRNSRRQVRWGQGLWVLPLVGALAGASCALEQRAAPVRGHEPSGQNQTAAATAKAPDPLLRAKVQSAYGKLPLSFEANQGQTDAAVKFLSRGRGYTLFLTPTEAVLALRKPTKNSLAPSSGERARVRGSKAELAEQTVLRMKLVGANRNAQVTGLDPLPGKANYFIGNDPKKWRTNVPTYARVEYRDVYPGVNLVYYGNQGHLEHDFVVAPGADPGVIQVAFEGPDSLELDASGHLVLRTPGGEVRLNKPLIYQVVDGARRPVPGNYARNPQSAIRNLIWLVSRWPPTTRPSPSSLTRCCTLAIPPISAAAARTRVRPSPWPPTAAPM